MDELIILYLVTNDEPHILEVKESELSNIKDFLGDLVCGGFNDFTLYNNCCNCGVCG